MKKLVLMALLALSCNGAYALEVGDTAPCVVLNQISPDGTETEHCIRDVANSDQTHTLIEFFSATCSDCLKNLPKVNALSKKIACTANTRLVGIDRSEELLRNYINTYKDQISFEVALDTDRDAKKAYGVVATPTLFVLDSDYKIVYKHVGVLSDSDAKKIKTLVGAGCSDE